MRYRDEYEGRYRNEYSNGYRDGYIDRYEDEYRNDYRDRYESDNRREYRDSCREAYQNGNADRYRTGYERGKDFWRSFRILRTVALISCVIAAVFIMMAAYTVKNEKSDVNSSNKGASNSYDPSSIGSTVDQPKLDENQYSQEDANNIINERNNQAVMPGIVIDGRTKLYAKAGEKVIQSINLTNNAANTAYYMSYELQLPNCSPQGYETLFKTDMITAGKAIPDVELINVLLLLNLI